jgi:hypothetical protein
VITCDCFEKEEGAVRAKGVVGIFATGLLSLIVSGCATSPSSQKGTTTTHVHTTTTLSPTTPSGVAVPAGFSPISVSALSPTRFFLLGISGPKDKKVATLLRSSNGGKSFVALNAPTIPLLIAQDSPPRETLNLHTVLFADPQDGYIFSTTAGSNGKTFYDTHNGGVSWNEQSFPGLLAFGVGGGFAYAITGTCGTDRCRGLSLRRSPVNQDAWSQLALPIEVSTPYASLSVYGNSLWATLDWIRGTREDQTILYSTNTGTTIATETSTCFPGWSSTIDATSSSIVWAMCPTGMKTSAFRSVNAGASWSALNLAKMSNTAIMTPASDSVAVVAPGDGTLVRITSGPTAPRVSFTPPTGTAPKWVEIHFATSTVGFALETVHAPTGTATFPYELLYRTMDAGNSWQPLSITSKR